MFEIVIAGHGLRCPAEGRVLLEMERQGKKFLPVGCRGGGCGICRVEVLRGRYRTLKMSRLHVSVEEQRRGFALACRLVPESDLELRPARRQAH
ncbi:MAG: 2Fe-2S iron-sulfur cluster binding domain-containing protein [Alphaproteobacteria bacterium]|nr:2Fe-2S iron-sulfur cluster binding domain-containing protein [Alphaproteobacteria bacterium]